jgi:hypothetical protein
MKPSAAVESARRARCSLGSTAVRQILARSSTGDGFTDKALHRHGHHLGAISRKSLAVSLLRRVAFIPFFVSGSVVQRLKTARHCIQCHRPHHAIHTQLPTTTERRFKFSRPHQLWPPPYKRRRFSRRVITTHDANTNDTKRMKRMTRINYKLQDQT